ncbi:hypothetical protein QCA50_007910 [Cerrena zonata]|uniref:Uncharacterized protein n=1 Tax=Cerrena zonata TaxID=2478898 RepID=A0AAW0GC31_9APHY
MFRMMQLCCDLGREGSFHYTSLYSQTLHIVSDQREIPDPYPLENLYSSRLVSLLPFVEMTLVSRLVSAHTTSPPVFLSVIVTLTLDASGVFGARNLTVL